MWKNGTMVQQSGVLHHCQLFVNNREVAFVKRCVWTKLVKFHQKKKKKRKWFSRLSLVVPVCCSTGPAFKNQCRCKWGELSRTLSLRAGLTFYMDGGKTWGAFDNPLIHWGIQVVKRLSRMELGNIFCQVKVQFPWWEMIFRCSEWREEDGEGEFKTIYIYFFLCVPVSMCAHTHGHRNTVTVAVHKNVFLHFWLIALNDTNSCFLVAVIDHIWVITIGWLFALALLMLFLYNAIWHKHIFVRVRTLNSELNCRHSV